MKEIPILFSTPMVQANLDGRKTQTRRILKFRNKKWRLSYEAFKTGRTDLDAFGVLDEHRNLIEIEEGEPATLNELQLCPYGEPGDIMYVREEHFRFGAWIEKEGEYTKGGRQKWMFVAHTDEILYEGPVEFRKGRHHKDPYSPAWHKRLARFMPKSSARIWLQVESTRVERLQDITEDDAKAEGVIVTPAQAESNATHRQVLKDRIPAGDHQLAFCNLWREIHFTSIQDQLSGKDGWNENPWVWVVSFNILSTTGKPDLKTIKELECKK